MGLMSKQIKNSCWYYQILNKKVLKTFKLFKKAIFGGIDNFENQNFLLHFYENFASTNKPHGILEGTVAENSYVLATWFFYQSGIQLKYCGNMKHMFLLLSMLL